ncbi:MAG: DUF2007 domain-containing protein [Cyclobacteriaceae bacterium]
MSNWQKIFSNELLYRAEIVKAVLEENDIGAVILNKKDTNYHLGTHDVLVSQDDILKAIKIIKEEINFE